MLDQELYGNIKILLVEDNEVDQFAFKRHCQKNNLPYDITVSPSMEETFLLLRTQTFDVVILDYMLKDGASVELVPHLVKKMEVIFVTGEDKLETAINAMKMGVYEYLVKDFEKSYLGILPKIIDSAYKHKLAADRLLKAEKQVNRLSLAMSNMDKAIIISNKDGRIEWVNMAFVKLSGYEAHEVLGTDGGFLAKDGVIGISPKSKYYNTIFKKLESVTYESTNLKKSGAEYSVLTTLSPVLNSSGELEEVVVVETDITTQKQKQQELNLAKLAAERSNQAKEQFLANMSHELRTPLNAIMGMGQMMDHTNLSKEQTEYLSVIKDSSKNLLVLIKDVLDFSKLNADELSLEEKTINLASVFDQIERSVKLKVNSSKIDFKMEIDPDVPNDIIADPIRIEQIVGNVVANAIKFTTKGDITIQVFTNDKKSQLSFRIQDSGVGISKDKLESIFEMFSQEDMSDTRKYEGVGIGLNIASSLVKMMKGKIEVKSEVDQGTIVLITLPLKLAAGKSIPSTKVTHLSDKSDLNGISVLLVEDNKMNQLLAQKFLSKLGAAVVVAGNGKEAIDEIKKKSFDLVLMDLQMPVMDGFEATKFIRENLKAPLNAIPIIAMTAHAISGIERKCTEMGLTEFITKPIMLDRLKVKMSQVLTNPVN